MNLILDYGGGRQVMCPIDPAADHFCAIDDCLYLTHLENGCEDTIYVDSSAGSASPEDSISRTVGEIEEFMAGDGRYIRVIYRGDGKQDKLERFIQSHQEVTGNTAPWDWYFIKTDTHRG